MSEPIAAVTPPNKKKEKTFASQLQSGPPRPLALGTMGPAAGCMRRKRSMSTSPAARSTSGSTSSTVSRSTQSRRSLFPRTHFIPVRFRLRIWQPVCLARYRSSSLERTGLILTGGEPANGSIKPGIPFRLCRLRDRRFFDKLSSSPVPRLFCSPRPSHPPLARSLALIPADMLSGGEPAQNGECVKTAIPEDEKFRPFGPPINSTFVYGNLFINFGTVLAFFSSPFFSFPQLCGNPHAPCDMLYCMPYRSRMLSGRWLVRGAIRCCARSLARFPRASSRQEISLGDPNEGSIKMDIIMTHRFDTAAAVSLLGRCMLLDIILFYSALIAALFDGVLFPKNSTVFCFQN